MKYIIFPSELLDNVPQEVLDELHLVPRKSVDGTEVIMKLCHYDTLFPSIMTLEDLEDSSMEVQYEYPTYNSNEVKDILSSSKWTDSDLIEN